MDPFSALSIAAAVAQFLDFGVKIITAANKIHLAEGNAEVVVELEENVKQFKDLGAHLRTIYSGAGKSDALSPTHNPLDILEIAKSCERFSEDASAVLAGLKLTSNKGRLSSLKLAIKLELRTADLTKLQKSLNERRTQLMLATLALLQDDSSSVKRMLLKLQERDIAYKTSISQQLDQLRRDMLLLCSNSQSPTHIPGSSGLSTQLRRLTTEAQRASTSSYVLSTLTYPDLRTREESIAPTHTKTFEWIFTSACPFTEWLTCGTSLFWIAGKAGSGKSTLMKFLFDHQRTLSALQTWAGNDKLVIARHFFWNDGSPLQKSQAGLYRSLCYDILRACPDLIPEVCAARIVAADPISALEPDVFNTVSWSLLELSRLLNDLSSVRLTSGGRNVRCCFFIDGLDEYQGSHDQIVTDLLRFEASRHIKICASSRPWNVFDHVFGDRTGLTLTLQELTHDDMVRYIADRLGEDQRFILMQSEDPACYDLVDEIIEKADGVFLWVYLVVNELRESLLNMDDFATLQRRLRRIPPTLEAYFRYMFDRLDAFYQADTAMIFSLTREAPFWMPVLAFSAFSPSDNIASKVLDMQCTVLTREEVETLEFRLEKRITGRCRDLIEVANHKVQFMHRTVRDFLVSEEMVGLVSQRAGRKFNINAAMCQMLLLSIKTLNWTLTGWTQEVTLTWMWLVPAFFSYLAKLEEQDLPTAQTLLSDFLTIKGRLTDPFMHQLPDGLELLALFHLPDLLKYESLRSPLAPEELTVLLWRCLVTVGCDSKGCSDFLCEYWFGNAASDYVTDDWPFSIDLLCYLIAQGAKPNKIIHSSHVTGSETVWQRLLRHIYSCSKEASGVRLTARRKAVIIEAAKELIMNGARLFRPLECFEPIPGPGGEEGWRSVSLTEAEAMQSALGPSDTSWLLSLRRNDKGRSWRSYLSWR